MKIIRIKTGNSTSPVVDYKADKTKYTAPEIVGKYTDENGVDQYELANGHIQTCESYNKLWFPQKGKVLPVNHREDIDSTHIK
jgi:hypothetical protein